MRHFETLPRGADDDWPSAAGDTLVISVKAIGDRDALR
jgi:hypothetical protein